MSDGRTAVNNFSIGIELINLNDGNDPYPLQQIEALRHLVQEIVVRHPIRFIVPHYECADPAGRKSDPARFNMQWVADLLQTDRSSEA